MDRGKRWKLMRESSMCYWFPRVASLLPVPRTVIIELPLKVLAAVYSGDRWSDFPAEFRRTVLYNARILGFPLFLRTDQASGKHRWVETCYVERERDLVSHIFRVLEFNECAAPFGLPYRALVLREYVPLHSAFRAFNGMPVARERRYFVENGRVLCHHPYWPQDAIEEVHHHAPGLPENWRELLSELNREKGDERAVLGRLARLFSSRVRGYWSVDFAYTARGEWILIDAARGEISWHPPCPNQNAPHRRGKQPTSG